jgi:gamma-glutamylcyclotransferase (GGCT)/AIG2-like uncharacterized protein YtfP
MLYFAYGSNMSSERLRLRVPSATTVGTASLRGYELRFRKRGRDGSAKCDAAARPGGEVHGVVYEIEPAGLEALDRFEPGYDRVEVEIVDRNGRALRAYTYLAQSGHVDDGLRPRLSYRAVVVAGAREHGLPEAYVAGIEAIVADPDLTR